jgi:hypothetical protein
LNTSYGGTEKVLLYINITKSLTNEINDCFSNMVWAPLHQAPTDSTHLSPLHLSLGNGLGLQWRKKARIGNSGSKLTMWLQILRAREEGEMGIVSLFLFLAFGMKPQNLLLYEKKDGYLVG